MSELVRRQVCQLLELLQWNVAEAADNGLIVASAKYGAQRLIYCPPASQKNLPKLVRKMKPAVPDWIVVPDDYEIDDENLDSLTRLGVSRVMRPWQFMDETFRSWDQALRVMEEESNEEDGDIEPRSYRGVNEKYIRQSYRGDVRGHDSLNLCMNLEPGANGLLLIVLAQAGYGKTWLTKAYTYEAAKRYLEFPGHRISKAESSTPLPPPIPFLIPFGEYRKLASIGAVIRERMEAVGVPEYTSSAFQYLLTKGRVVLVLDGFDELLESSPYHARENLREIQQAVLGRGIMILTSRTTFFRNQRDVDSFLGTSRPTDLELIVATIDPFDDPRRLEFLTNRGATEQEIVQISRLSMGELSGGPQTLAFLLSIVREGVVPTQTTTRAEVFSEYAERVFARERDRQGFLISDEQQTAFLQDLAYETLCEDMTVLSRDLVEIATPDGVSAGDHSKLLSHYFLQPAQDGLTFEHHLVRDFFAARSIRDCLHRESVFEVLDAKLTEGTAGFLAELLSDKEVKTFVASARNRPHVYRNLLLIALEKIDRQEVGKGSTDDETARRASYLSGLLGRPSLARADLEGLEFSLLNFSGWSFGGCRARHARFVCCDLRGASGTEALSDAIFESCLRAETRDESSEEKAVSRLRRFLTLFARPGDAFSFATSELYEKDIKQKRKTFWDDDVASGLTALGFAHKERAKRSQPKLVLDRETELRDFYFRGRIEPVSDLLQRLQR